MKVLSRLIGVSFQGFYSWLKTKDKVKENRNSVLVEKIKEIHQKSRSTYGSPRVHETLFNKGLKVNHKRIERLMKKHNIRAKTKRKFKNTTDSNHNKKVAANLLKRNFNTTQPNKAWVSDITYVWTDEGWLYLCTFLDLYSRMIVGWSMNSRMTSSLVIDAFNMAKKRRGGITAEIIHTDRGSQYASDAFKKIIKNNGCKQSMSRKANCWDNSVAESFFSTLKLELIYHHKFKSRIEAKTKIFEYIESFYNKDRIHSTLCYKSPLEFERCFNQELRAM